ncbi:MAG: sigma-70 family RNA polymerase sigma factor, partial [Planctomycetia bacterium]
DRIETYRPQNQFQAWLFRLAHRIWVDDYRRQQSRSSVALEEAHSVPAQDQGPVERQITEETKNRINSAIETLPDPIRETLLLRVDGQLTCREIAEALECPLGTVLWRLRDARQRLTKILDP